MLGKAVRNASKDGVQRQLGELVKMIQALGVGEEDKVGELVDEGKVEKASVGDVRMEDCPSVTPTEALEDVVGVRGLPTTSRIVLSRPANSSIPEQQTANRTTKPTSASDPIGTPQPIAQEPPTTDLGNIQDDGKWTPNCPLVDGQHLRVYFSCLSAGAKK